MQSEDARQRGMEIALTYLDRKMYTRHQLLAKLTAREVEPDICQWVLDELEQMGYVNDLDYAIRYAKDGIVLRKYGIRRIRQGLRQKGVADHVVQAALEELESELDPAQQLQELIAAKAARLDLSDPKQKNKVVGFLVRRGYAYGDIFAALNAYGSNEW